MNSEKTGVDFVLYATDEERLAIKTVNLFIKLLTLAARKGGLDMLTIRIVDLHKHLPDFAWAKSLVHVNNLARYRQGDHPFCTAVDLHQQAYAETEAELLSYIFYLHKPLEEERVRQELEIEAKELGIPDILGTYESLLESAKISLGNILNRTV